MEYQETTLSLLADNMILYFKTAIEATRKLELINTEKLQDTINTLKDSFHICQQYSHQRRS